MFIDGLILGLGIGIGAALVNAVITIGTRVYFVITDEDYWKLRKYNKSQQK